MSAVPQAARPRVPLGWLAISALAMLMLAAGACGLLQPALLPMLAPPAVAWSLIAAGLMLDAMAVLQILQGVRRR